MLLDTTEIAKIAEKLYFLGVFTQDFYHLTNKRNKKNVAETILEQLKEYHDTIPHQIRNTLEKTGLVKPSQLEKDCQNFSYSKIFESKTFIMTIS